MVQATNHVEFEKNQNRDKEKGFSLSLEENHSLLFDRKKKHYKVGTKTPLPHYVYRHNVRSMYHTNPKFDTLPSQMK